MAHSNPTQVRRLISRIWSPHDTIVIHYDKKSPKCEHREIQDIARQFGNVIVQPSLSVLWGRFSLLRAQLSGMKCALDSGVNWSHWINLSGQCYPLVSAALIHERMNMLGESSLVRSFDPLQESDWGATDERIRFRYVNSAAIDRLLRVPFVGRKLRQHLFGGAQIPRWPFLRGDPLDGVRWYGGDNWVSLSRSAAKYICTSSQAEMIISMLRFSALPEESVFQTVLMNSEFSRTVVNSHGRMINWSKGKASPGVFTERDYDSIELASRQGALFARKFDANLSASLLDKIDCCLLAS